MLRLERLIPSIGELGPDRCLGRLAAFSPFFAACPFALIVTFFLGILFLLPGLPLFVTLIGGSEVVFYALVHLVKFVPFLGKIPGMIWDFGAKIGAPHMKDERDGPYFLPVIFLTLWSPLIFSWALYRYMHYGFEVSTCILYHALRLTPRYRLFAYLHVLLHKEGHSNKGLFKGPLEVLNFGIMHFFTGMFYGALPYSYPMAHNKIHHAYDNDLDDVHTNLDLDRSKPISFIYYLPRFALYWAGISPAILFAQKGQWTFFKKNCFGMAIMYAVWYFFWNKAGAMFTIYFVMYPFIESVVFFGGISYLWHAWCDPKDINNPYVDSMTIVNGQDNIFNEDFHVVHHTKPMAHWTEYPTLYEEYKKEYQKYNATIFTDCEEGMLLYWLFSEKWDTMAEHMVDLSGKMNHEEKKALCLERLRSQLER